MRLAVWRLEWRLALRRRRLLILNVAIPLILVVPLEVGGAPAYHASAAYAVLFVLFATFGSAIPLLRDGEGGTLRRIVLRGVPEPVILGERVLAGSALDCLELLPALGVVLLLEGAEASIWLWALPTLPLAVLGSNLVGVWVAAGARSIAEGALFAALASLFLLHGSGVFRTPEPGGLGELLEVVLPFGPLHKLLFAAVAGGADAGLGFTTVLPSIGLALVLLGLTLAVSRILMQRITAPAR